MQTWPLVHVNCSKDIGHNHLYLREQVCSKGTEQTDTTYNMCLCFSRHTAQEQIKTRHAPCPCFDHIYIISSQVWPVYLPVRPRRDRRAFSLHSSHVSLGPIPCEMPILILNLSHNPQAPQHPIPSSALASTRETQARQFTHGIYLAPIAGVVSQTGWCTSMGKARQEMTIATISLGCISVLLHACWATKARTHTHTYIYIYENDKPIEGPRSEELV